MKYFSFSSNPQWVLFTEGKRWALYDTKAKEWEIPSPIDIVEVLDSTKSVCEECFGKQYTNNTYVSVIPNDDNPCTFKDKNIMFLSAKGRRWNQFAYQFSHELCHMMIPSQLADQLCWFEESLCELASFYFLKRLSQKWVKNAPYSHWASYAPNFSSYFLARQAKEYKLTATSFPDFFKQNIEMLSNKNNSCRRDINCLCANALLPIFEEAPELWKDVPILCSIPLGLAFCDSLGMWHDLSVERNAIKNIMNLFGY